jgi:Tol biopolymer transport system component
MEEQVRELLRDIAGEIPPQRDVPPPLRARARRRLATTVGAAMVATVALVFGSVVAVRSINPSPSITPVREPDLLARVKGWVAYGDNDGVWAVNPTGSDGAEDRVKLSDVPGQPIAWSTDGSALLIRGLEQRELNAGAPQGLWVLHSDGTETRLLSENDGYAGASISPDGSRVVYAVWERGGPRGHTNIFVVDSDGGAPQLLTRGRGQRSYVLLDPTFSPNGAQIAYVDGEGGCCNGVSVMDADGTGARILLPTYGKDGLFDWPNAVGWSADGSHIAFAGQGAIFIIAADGSGLTKLIPQVGGDSQWSPTGSRLAFVHSGQIFVMNADGSGQRQLTNLPRESEVEHGWPRWSPDGTRIAFVDDKCECGIGTLYTMAADGTDVRAIGSVRPDGSIAWNPVGQSTVTPSG